MNERLITNVCREVYRRFPELLGVRPKIQIYGSESTRSNNPAPKFLLVFKGKGETAAQKPISYLVRVVVNEQGKILKMSMSR
jgi:hypothetical protein